MTTHSIGKVKQPRAAAYLRVSTAQQVEEGSSLGEQREAIEHYSAEQGFAMGPDDWYVDEGISGRRLNRPAFNRMLEAVKANKYDWVIVWRLDRSSRRASTGYKLKDTLDATNTEIFSITQGHINSRLMYGFWLLIAEQESEDKSVRSRMGARARAKRGQISHKAVYGFRMSRTNGKPIIHIQESKAVKRIFAEYVSGVRTTDIIEGLIRDGVRTRSGKLWSHREVILIIQTTEYYGVGHFGKIQFKYGVDDERHTVRQDPENWIEIAFPPLIDKDSWDAAQVIRSRNTRLRTTTVNGDEFPLRGLLWCGSCGRRFVHQVINRYYKVRRPDGSYESKKQKPGRAYACYYGRHKNSNCDAPKKTVGAAKLENLVWSKVREVLEHPEAIGELIEARHREFEASGSHKDLEVAARNLDGVEEERQKLITMYQKAYLSEAELDIRMRGINERREMYGLDLARLESEMENYQQYVSMLEKFAARAEEITDRLDNLTPQERNEIMSALVERVDMGAEITVHTILDDSVLTGDLSRTPQCSRLWGQ